MLEKFQKAKAGEIAALLRESKSPSWREPQVVSRPSFLEALENNGRIRVIAEYKRASPSRGVIRPDLTPEEVAEEYVKGGASALSILTEKQFFQGDMDFLRRAGECLENKNIPLLRKDFIYHPIQIVETAKTRASAILLIVRCIPDADKLRDFRLLAQKYNLEAVVEVFDKKDLEIARESGARVIQANARDLDSLRVSREACLKLLAENPARPHEKWIAASGIEKPEHLKAAADAGYDACLIGSALMEKPSPGNALKELLHYAD